MSSSYLFMARNRNNVDSAQSYAYQSGPVSSIQNIYAKNSWYGSNYYTTNVYQSTNTFRDVKQNYFVMCSTVVSGAYVVWVGVTPQYLVFGGLQLADYHNIYEHMRFH